jgi:hypothetical protein
MDDMRKKLHVNKVRHECINRNIKFMDSVFNGVRARHNFFCVKHKKTYATNYNNLIQAGGCNLPCCATHEFKKYTLKEVKDKCDSINIEFIDKKYLGRTHKHKFKCIKHGEIYTKSLADILHKDRVLRCCNLDSKFRKYKLIAKKRGFMVLDSKYKNLDSKYATRCLRHNEVHQARLINIVRANSQGIHCCWINMKRRSGDNHPNYNPNLTKQERLGNRSKCKSWRFRIYKLFDNTCDACGSVGLIGINRIAHHIESYMSNKKLRFDINNGACLCSECHDSFHKTYGYGNNTRAQYDEFKSKVIA